MEGIGVDPGITVALRLVVKLDGQVTGVVTFGLGFEPTGWLTDTLVAKLGPWRWMLSVASAGRLVPDAPMFRAPER